MQSAQLLIPTKLIADLQRACRRHSPKEAGGILLGMRKRDAIQITEATYPFPWDRASPTLFHRSVRGHRIKALREWKRSNGTVDWVGEWHSHPFGALRPSPIDVANWRALRRHTGRTMIFVITGPRRSAVWLKNGQVSVMDLDEEDEVHFLFSAP